MSVGATAVYPWDPESLEDLRKFRIEGGFLKSNWVGVVLGAIAMWCDIRYKKGMSLPFLCFPSRENFEALSLEERAMLVDQIVEFISP